MKKICIFLCLLLAGCASTPTQNSSETAASTLEQNSSEVDQNATENNNMAENAKVTAQTSNTFTPITQFNGNECDSQENESLMSDDDDTECRDCEREVSLDYYPNDEHGSIEAKTGTILKEPWTLSQFAKEFNVDKSRVELLQTHKNNNGKIYLVSVASENEDTCNQQKAIYLGIRGYDEKDQQIVSFFSIGEYSRSYCGTSVRGSEEIGIRNVNLITAGNIKRITSDPNIKGSVDVLQTVSNGEKDFVILSIYNTLEEEFTSPPDYDSYYESSVTTGQFWLVSLHPLHVEMVATNFFEKSERSMSESSDEKNWTTNESYNDTRWICNFDIQGHNWAYQCQKTEETDGPRQIVDQFTKIGCF